MRITAPYVTPDQAPASGVCRRLYIPDHPAFHAAFNDVLTLLTKPESWDDTQGGITALEASTLCAQMWYEVGLLPCEPVKPPYFDTDDTVDDDENSETEDITQNPDYPWYEQILDWFWTGYLAVTFTPLAGVVYKTVIPRIRLAFRAGDAGAIFKILIDGVEAWTGDTFSPVKKLIDIIFDVEKFAQDNNLPGTEHEITIQHTGTHNASATPTPRGYSLELVRGDIRELTDLTDAIIKSPEVSTRNVIQPINGPYVIPLTLQGANGQSFDLTQWKDFAGTVLGKMTSQGTLHAVGFNANAGLGAFNGRALRGNPVSINDNTAANIYLAQGGGLTTVGAQSPAFGKFHVFVADALTNSLAATIGITHNSSGTPDAGFGLAIALRGKSSTTADREMSRIETLWQIASDVTRKARLQTVVYDTTTRTVVLGHNTDGVDLAGDQAYHLGRPNADGSWPDGVWRIIQSGNDLVMQRRESASWVTKQTISA